MRGRVRSLTEFGAFVEVEPGVEGLIHLSDLTWSKKVKRPAEVLQQGQEIDAKVLRVDVVNRRLNLGLKQLQPDVVEQYCACVRVGQMVRGRATRRTPFGVFVELGDAVEGLCHVSELAEADEAAGPVELGKEYEFKIIKLNPGERRIGLSRKAMAAEQARRSLEAYRASQPSSATTIGEIVSRKVGTRDRSGS